MLMKILQKTAKKKLINTLEYKPKLCINCSMCSTVCPHSVFQPGKDTATLGNSKAIIADNRIKNILDELTDWPGTVLNSHKSANQPFYKLFFLTDLGITEEDIPEIIQKVLTHVSDEGPFTLPMNQFIGVGENGILIRRKNLLVGLPILKEIPGFLLAQE